jgi:hypothetical protein
MTLGQLLAVLAGIVFLAVGFGFGDLEPTDAERWLAAAGVGLSVAFLTGGVVVFRR